MKHTTEFTTAQLITYFNTALEFGDETGYGPTFEQDFTNLVTALEAGGDLTAAQNAIVDRNADDIKNYLANAED